METFAAIYNNMKNELKAKFSGCTFNLTRVTETHTAWTVSGQSGRFIVVREEEDGHIYVDSKYDWSRK